MIQEPQTVAIGQPVPRVDGVAKVTARAQYVDDLPFPQALVGRLLRSPFAHARIKAIDTSAAERLDGVEAVLTAKDFPDVLSGGRLKDRPLIARAKVRWAGEPVAAVAAVDRETAERALKLIRVEYEPLPAVFDIDSALQPDAPLVHEQVAEYSGYLWGPPMEGLNHNVCAYVRLERGDVDVAFASAPVVVEGTYRTHRQACAPIEPHGAVALADPVSGRTTIWTTTAMPLWVRAQTAEFLAIPLSRIEIVTACVGGGFGGKVDADPEPFAAALSLRTGRPVKVIFTRTEEFIGPSQRLPSRIWMRTGADRDGRLLAREAKLFYDTGGRGSMGTLVVGYITTMATGPYAIPHVRLMGYTVYTNNVPGGAVRGFGDIQLAFAYESQMDELAGELGMDPVELRRRNLVQEGDVMPTGRLMRSVTAQECFELAVERLHEAERSCPPPLPTHRRASGVANTEAVYGGSPSSAAIRLNHDGTFTLTLGTPDIGQGSDTVLTQIAAETLSVPASSVFASLGSINTGPMDAGAFASRVTFHTGNAVYNAARKVRERMCSAAAAMLRVEPEELTVHSGVIAVANEPQRKVTFADVAVYVEYVHQEAVQEIGTHGGADYEGSRIAEGTHYTNTCTNAFASHAAIVDVDTETGQAFVRKLISVHDCGRVINPALARAQIHGGAVMGVAFALGEELLADAAGPLNAEFRDYLIPSSLDAPDVEPHLIEKAQPDGPFGAKGMGEGSPVGASTAVARAIMAAIDRPIRRLPLTPERILTALDEGSA